LQKSNAGGSFDAFVAKLAPGGSALEYSSYLGGSGLDSGFGIAIGPGGDAYLMGMTDSSGFPTVNPLQPANAGGRSDLFIARIQTKGPRISGASVTRKKLTVTGTGFDDGAKILVNGVEQKTANDPQNPSGILIGKKAGKKIAAGATVSLQVRNSDGTFSNEFRFTR
jgi:hypothetical protein